MKRFPNKSLSSGFGWLIVASLAVWVAPAALAQADDVETGAAMPENQPVLSEMMT